jgi:SAM-dependent methyltransferase
MNKNNNDPFQDLIQAYDRAVDFRDAAPVSDWKKDLRWKFLSALKEEARLRLIDIGAGTGIHALFFQSRGIDVSCIDITPALVEKCREKGLPSQVISVLDLAEIGQTFDAAFAMNSLLHIPSRLLPKALANIAKVLAGEGLFFWGQYGGVSQEGIYQDDHYRPKRFFSLLDDQQIQEFASVDFTIEAFDRIQMDSQIRPHFQSLLLRVKPS